MITPETCEVYNCQVCRKKDEEARLSTARSKAGYLRALTKNGPSGSHYHARVAWAAADLSDFLNSWGRELRLAKETDTR